MKRADVDDDGVSGIDGRARIDVSCKVLNANYAFDHWSGDLTGNNNPESLTMDGTKSVVAHFVTIQGVSVSIPNSTACPAEQISIPIVVGDLTALDVFSSFLA